MKPWSGLFVCTLCLGLAISRPPAAPAAETPDLETGPAPAYNHIGRQIAHLDEQIAERLGLLSLADPLAAESIRASINYRIIAKTLLSKGRAAGKSGVVAMLQGLRLMRHVRDADRLFEKMPQWIRQARKDQPGAIAGRDAVRAFNRIAAKEADALAAVAPAAVDRYLSRLMSPLALGTPPRSAWFAASKQATAPPIRRAEIAEAPASPLVKTEMAALLGRLNHPTADPRLADALRLAVSVSHGLEKNRWIGSENHGLLSRQHFTATLLAKDRRTRDTALEKLRLLAGTLRRITALRQIHRLATPIEPLLAMVLKNHRQLYGQLNPAQSRQVAEALDQALEAMAGFRKQIGRPLPLPVANAAREVRKRYQQAELAFLGIVAEPSASPQTLLQRGDDLKKLQDAYDHFQYVYSIPAWAERLKRFKPKNPNSLLHQLVQTASTSLKQTPEAAKALRRLAGLESQLRRFDPMPHLQQLENADPQLQAVTGGTETMLLAQIERLRNAWASAHAQGADPSETVERLEWTRRLLQHIHEAMQVQSPGRSAKALNRWAAWDAPAAATVEQRKKMNRMIGQAGLLASVGNWAKLEQTLEDLERQMSLLLLMGRLHSALPQQEPQPLSMKTLLSQILHSPTNRSFAAEHRQALASICIDLHAARDRPQAPEAQAALTRGRAKAHRLLRTMENVSTSNP
ncbi:MAG: hypothetical protein R3236_00380 [Phycisphaeraceae bacterium]|nr:hypothetical protein [Phycisphaeraceae bacterium]